MRRTLALVLCAAAVLPAATFASERPSQTKAQAEIHVLQIVPRSWPARRLPGIIVPRTHVLVRNTQAVCRGRGARLAGRRYTHFVCVVRPLRHLKRQGLYVSYRAEARGRAIVHWLEYRKR